MKNQIYLFLTTLCVLFSGSHFTQNVLFIYDDTPNNSNLISLQNTLTTNGFNVVVSTVSESMWDNTNPSLTGFDAVIHFNGTTYSSEMPNAGQNALVNFVQNQGGLYVSSEWNAYQINGGEMLNMRDLILLDRSSGSSRTMNFVTTTMGQNHPVLLNLPSTFTILNGEGNVGNVHVFSSQPAEVLMTEGTNDAVVVREFGMGKVLNFHHSGNYASKSHFSDSNIQQIILNFLNWGGVSTGGFTANQTVICEGDSIQFNDTTSSNTISWLWDFGDGNSSTLENPYHTYNTGGNYTVSLSLTDSSGQVTTATSNNFIQVIGANVVSGNSNDSVCSIGGGVQLNTSFFITNNIPYNINWSNGATSDTLSMLSQGSYNYTLSSNGCLITDTFQIGTGLHNAVSFQTSSTNVSCYGFDGTAQVSMINGQTQNYFDDFNSGSYNSSLWSTVSGGYPSFGCGTFSGSYALYFNSSSTRYATTNPMAIGSGSSIEFYLKIASSSTSSCENADSGEDVVLEYSTNGSNWTIINTYNTSLYSSFTYINETMPNLSQSNNIRLRWRQLSHSGNGYDNWAIDDVSVNGYNLNNYSFQWNDLQLQTTAFASSLDTGYYTITVTDSIGCTGIDTVYIGDFVPLNISVSSQDISCQNFNDGSAIASVSGGQAPYNFQYSSGNTYDSTGLYISAGPQYVTVTDANNCSAVESFYINDANVPSITLNPSIPNCNIPNSGSIACHVSGGNNPFSYQWNDTFQQTSDSAVSLVNGTYTINITDSLGCVYDTSITISNEIEFNVYSYSPSCFGFSDGSAVLEVLNSSGYSVAWGNGGVGDSISNLADGFITFSVVDSVLCSITDSIAIIEPDSIVLTALINNSSCNLPNGSIQVSASNYHSSMVLETKNNGYWSTSNMYEYFSSVSPDHISFDIMSPDVSDVNNYHGSILFEDGSADMIWFMMSSDQNTGNPVMGPIGSYTIGSVQSWGGYYMNAFNYSPNTWYHVEFRNINYVSDTYDYYVDNQLIASSIPFRQYGSDLNYIKLFHYTAQNVTMYLDNLSLEQNGSSIWLEDFENSLSNWYVYNTSYTNNIINSANITNGGISYLWNNGNSSNLIDSLSTGNYSVTASSNANCFVNQTYQIVDVGTPVMTLNSSNASCLGINDGVITVSANGGNQPYTYNYSHGGGYGLNTVSEGAENGMGNFTTSGNNLFYTTTTYSHSGNYSYFNDYDNSDLNYLTYSNNIDLTNINNASLNFWHIAKTEGYYDRCFIQYSDNGGATWQNFPSSSYSGNATNYTGSYPYFDEDSYTIWYSSSSPSNTWWQEENFDLSFLYGENDVRIRFFFDSDGSVIRHGWLIDDITINSTSTNDSTLYNLSPGMVTVTLTDNSGCQVVDSIQVGVNQNNLSLTLSSIDASCDSSNNGIVIAQASGGSGLYSYDVNGVLGTNANVTGLSPGLVTVIVADTNGCSVQDSVMIGVGSGFSANIQSTNITCFGDSNGTISVNPIGGSSPFQYLWNGVGVSSGLTEDFEQGVINSTWSSYSGTIGNNCGVVSGNSALVLNNSGTRYIQTTALQTNSNSSISFYLLYGSSSNSCETVDIGEEVSFQYSSNGVNWYTINTYNLSFYQTGQFEYINEVIPAYAQGSSMYYRLVQFSNSGLNYDVWSIDDITFLTNGINYSGNNQLDSLSAGIYYLDIVDSNGCYYSDSIIIQEPPQMSVNAVAYSTNNLCFGDQNGTGIVNVSGGNGPYSHSWSNGQTTNVANNLGEGAYQCITTDLNGCQVVSNIQITTPPELSAITTYADISCFGMNDGTANISITGGTPPYNIIWSNGLTDTSLTNLSAGSYFASINDQNNCNHQSSVIITEPAEIQILFMVTDANPNLSDGSITAFISGGTGPYSFDWSNGNTSATMNNLSSGVYILTLHDANNCTKIDSVFVGTVNTIYKQNEYHLSIAPNPFLEETIIRFIGSSLLFDVEILNIQGERVEYYTNIKSSLRLTKGDKSAGTYFVKIYPRGKGYSIQEKIIIQ